MFEKEKYYAHSLEGSSLPEWQQLSEHLMNVANRASSFAESFGAKDWALLLGENHDLGKGTNQWQAYLRQANNLIDEFSKYDDGHPSHAFAGAQWLYSHSKDVGKLLAYCIAGHHAGLPDWDGGEAALQRRLGQQLHDVTYPCTLPNFPKQPPITFEPDRLGFHFQFFIRMLFSCLVDADFLDTEKFINEKEKAEHRGKYPSVDVLHHVFWKNFDEMRKGADQTQLVNQQRELVLADCLQAAEQEPGLFSLTVPTGGGKTLSSLAFALNHALEHKKQRIIYVIPFTSIIEQNAKVFRDILGSDCVLEHHCNFHPDDLDWQAKLASENWDAPIIVTTNVQFFDSFYASKPSKCRKLHNIANSIIIFDEVQAIPVEKLEPCLEVIKELSLNYGVSTVLCTATQPAIHYSESFASGLKNVREIVQDIPQLFSALKRTKEIYIGELDEQEVAALLLEHKQVLCIVNTRDQALDIFNALPDSDENIHLSALMFPLHRTEKLNEIRERLNPVNSQPCRVVSTQLIEAGVDVDFPSVFRLVAGIDSIAQAAGRCNRNGLSDTPQKVSVFNLTKESGCSFFRDASQSAMKLFEPFAGRFTHPDCIREYFADLFWKNEDRMDEDGIVDKCRRGQSLEIQFREIAEFKMIKSATEPIIIALDDVSLGLVRSLEFTKYKRGVLRKLQQYSVQIYPYQLAEIEKWLKNPEPGIWVLTTNELYSKATGLQCKSPEGNAFFG